MIHFEFLKKGVNALANAHRAGTMAGHLGAAVAAGYFFGEDQSDWRSEVFTGIEGELKRVIAGEEAIWFNAKKAGVTPTELFRPVDDQPQEPIDPSPLVVAIGKNVGRMRQSGHNIIFASIAIRALHDHPDFATPNVVAGVRKLIEGFDNAHPGRGYFGKEKGWSNGDQVKLTAADKLPPYRTVADMVNVTIGELIATAATKKQGFGGLWHIINHAAAIAEMQRLGFEDVAKRALPAHQMHIQLWRRLPDVESELGPVKKSEHNPREASYWEGMLKRDQARLTHRIKTLYGYYTIRRFVQDATLRSQADDALLYLMA